MATVLRRSPTSATDSGIYMDEDPQSGIPMGVIPSMLEVPNLITIIDVDPSTVKSAQMISWFGANRKKLNELYNLKDGWDSYLAPSPNAPALQLAEDFLDHLSEFNIRPVHLGPCVAGGVGFTFLGSKQEYVVEFENDGHIVTSVIDSDAEPISVVTNERSTDVEPLDIIIEELRRLDGV